MLKALQIGIFAAYAVSDAQPGKAASLEKYGKMVARAFESYTEMAREYYCQEQQRWPDSPFWQRRHRTRPLRDSVRVS